MNHHKIILKYICLYNDNFTLDKSSHRVNFEVKLDELSAMWNSQV